MSTSSRQSRKSRRTTRRVPGPFVGRRLGALSVDVHIHDLSAGGCLIQSFHDVPVGRRMKLEIDLPHEGRIELDAESVNTRPDYGFAVKFIDVADDVRDKIDRAIDRLLAERT
jgi:hypothetical protein